MRQTPAVRANVVDITVDAPQASDKILVDTSALLPLAYSKGTSPSVSHTYQALHYPEYIQKCLKVGAQLFVSPLALIELAWVIEKKEAEIMGIPPKTLRHSDPVSRANTCLEVKTALDTTMSMMNELASQLTFGEIRSVITQLPQCELDPTDYMQVQAALAAGIDCVLSDDSDYLSNSKITLFTANPSTLDAARQASQLESRGAAQALSKLLGLS